LAMKHIGQKLFRVKNQKRMWKLVLVSATTQEITDQRCVW